MFTKKEVTDYVNSNILHSELYDTASDKKREKAVNQSLLTLSEHIEEDELSLRDVAEQTVFLFKLDSTIQRAELGVNYIMVDGVQMTITEKDRTLAPSVMKRHGIVDTHKRRVGRYHTPHSATFRFGNGGT